AAICRTGFLVLSICFVPCRCKPSDRGKEINFEQGRSLKPGGKRSLRQTMQVWRASYLQKTLYL
ncbi:hypothetical protein, partial [Solibaculum intestinale]